MSDVVAAKTYLIATAIGNIKMESQLVTDFDIEDIVHAQAISQAKLVQLVNLGQEIDASAQLPKEALPSVFRNNTEGLS